MSMRMILPFFVLAVSVFSGCTTYRKGISLVSPSPGEVLRMHPNEMRTFLLLPDEERKEYFNDKEKRAVLYQQHQSIPNVFKWNSISKLKECRIEFALDPGFTIPAQEFIMDIDMKAGTASVCNFQAGKEIYWRVLGVSERGTQLASPVSVFRTENILPRQLTIPGVDNVRDMGGWKTADGRRMRQGLIFRSAGFNQDSPDWQWDEKKRIPPEKSRIGDTLIEQPGIDYLVKSIGVRTDLDLRWDGEVAVMKESPLGSAVRWVHISSYDYGRLFSEEGMKAVREDFKLFADKANYPIVFHCIAGADRTGTLAFILCGLAGVEPDDLRKDWEVTARDYFSYAKYDNIAPGFDKYGEEGDPLSLKIRNFLLSLGVTQQEIDDYLSIILEDQAK